MASEKTAMLRSNDPAEYELRVLFLHSKSGEEIDFAALAQEARCKLHEVYSRSGALEVCREHPEYPVVVCTAAFPDNQWQDLLKDVQEMPEPPEVVLLSHDCDPSFGRRLSIWAPSTF